MYGSNVSFAVIPRLSKEVEELFIKTLLEKSDEGRESPVGPKEGGSPENGQNQGSGHV
jgi:hypothetical protein